VAFLNEFLERRERFRLTATEVNAAVRAMNDHQAIAHVEDSTNTFEYVFEKGGTVLVRCSCGDEWDVTER
jgi:hypothetical protein